MPYGSWINDLPTGFFLTVHIAAFAIGAGFAWLAAKRGLQLLTTAFSLFAAAELVYMTYHLDWTVFLFAHTNDKVLVQTAAGLRPSSPPRRPRRQPCPLACSCLPPPSTRPSGGRVSRPPGESPLPRA